MDETQFGHGAIDQPEDYFQEGSYRHEEIAGASIPVTWIEKDLATGFDIYPIRNQGAQESCVTYALAKQLAVDELSENGIYRELSPRSLYPYVFVPGGGSSAINATNVATKQGMTLEYLLPTDGLQESEVEKDTGYGTDAKLIALVYKPDSFIQCPTDFETIASILSSFKAQGKKKVITVTVRGINNGTWFSNFPKPPDPSNAATWAHRISITDFGLIGGKKVLAFDNTFGINAGNKGQQFFTEDYVPYIYGGIYTLNKPDNLVSLAQTVPPPTYTWNVDLATGSSGPDVLMLQKALQSMGMFPINTVVIPTGNFYGITKAAVQLFQTNFGLPITGKVDEITRQKLNDIF